MMTQVALLEEYTQREEQPAVCLMKQKQPQIKHNNRKTPCVLKKESLLYENKFRKNACK